MANNASDHLDSGPRGQLRPQAAQVQREFGHSTAVPAELQASHYGVPDGRLERPESESHRQMSLADEPNRLPRIGLLRSAVTAMIGAGTVMEYLDNHSALAASVTVGGRQASFNFVIDGGGAPITPGIKGDLVVPFNCTIKLIELLADQRGDIILDIWKARFADYPPTIAGSITGSSQPTLKSAEKGQDSTLAGWIPNVSAGDILRLNVNAASNLTRITLALLVQVIS